MHQLQLLWVAKNSPAMPASEPFRNEFEGLDTSKSNGLQ
jgi:hypothetical protein